MRNNRQADRWIVQKAPSVFNGKAARTKGEITPSEVKRAMTFERGMDDDYSQ